MDARELRTAKDHAVSLRGAAVLIAVPFLLGGLAGVLACRAAALGGTEELVGYIGAYVRASVEGTAEGPGVWPLLWGSLKYPLAALVLGFTALGLIGLPVFTATVGPAVIATPSFGYLIAFPFEAAVTSAAAGRLADKKWGRYAAVLTGVIASYAIALPYVAVLKGVYLNAPVPPGVLLSAYCFAFLPMDIVKAAMAALLAGRLEKPLGLTALRSR